MPDFLAERQRQRDAARAAEERRARQQAEQRRAGDEYSGPRSERHPTTGVTETYDATSAEYAPTTDDVGSYIDSSGRMRKRNWRRAERAADRQRGLWYQSQVRDLEGHLPTADDLSYEAEQERTDILLGDSAAGQAHADPEAIAAQRRALEEISGDARTFRDIYKEGGYTATERAQMDRTMQAGRANERAQRQAIEQRMGARGILGGGQQLASELAAQQGQANVAQMQGAEIAASGQERALRALAQAGGLSGRAGSLSSQMRGQSFGEASDRGTAIDRFRMSDVDYQRGAEQRRADRETESRRHRTGARQQEFENRTGVTDRLIEAASRGKEEEEGTKGRIDEGAKSSRTAGVKAAGSVIGGMAMLSDMRLKRDIQEIGHSPSGIPEYSFRYVFDPTGTVYRGALAQEVRETHPGAVVDMGSGVLGVDYDRIDVDFGIFGGSE